MEEPSSHLEQYGGRSTSITGNKLHDDGPSRPQYSMPGILHFLQTEWARFEMDRAQWEVDRAELQVNVSVILVIEIGDTEQSFRGFGGSGNIFIKITRNLIKPPPSS